MTVEEMLLIDTLNDITFKTSMTLLKIKNIY